MAMAGVSRDAHAVDGTARAGETDGKSAAAAVEVAVEDPHSGPGGANRREKFLPVTRHALMDRLTADSLWPDGDAAQARRFMRYLDFWRRHSYAAELLALEQAYEPFSPDSDLRKTRTYSPQERAVLQKRLVAQIAGLLEQGNFTRVDPSNVHFILTKDFGLRARSRGRPRGVRGGADLLPRCHHDRRAPA